MKKIFILLAFISFSAFAMTEVECTGRYEGQDIRIEIEGRYNVGYFRDVLVSIVNNGSTTTTRSSANFRPPYGSLQRAIYQGSDLILEVDFWPDSFPRWQKPYFANAFVRKLGSSGANINVNCRYPFAP
jgi:hypothetical protein